MGKELNQSQRANYVILKRTFFLMAVFGFLIFIPLVVKLYDIQIVDHDYYESKAVEQQTRDTVISPIRGTVYDRNNKVLAISTSVETIFISPVDIENDAQGELVAKGLSEILDVDYQGVLEKTKKKNYYQTIKKKIEKDLADRVRTFISENELEKIVHIEPDYKRYYPYGDMAANIIGFVGEDNTGLEGIEAVYNSLLQGTPGRVIAARDAGGLTMPFQYEKYYDAENGVDIQLTIDETIQRIVENHLETARVELEVANRASCIVMDVNSAEILAMSTQYSYDLNAPRVLVDAGQQAEVDVAEGDEKSALQSEYQLAQWRNKAVNDTYEPGSTFKIITTAVALEEKVVDLDDSFNCPGYINVPGWSKPIRCHKNSGHGTETFVEGVQNSCNPVFVTVGLRVGTEKFYDYMKAFGFMEKTGVDLPGESGSVYHDWATFNQNDVSLATYSFGQNFTITPIQLITAVSAVANGGYLMKPQIIKQFTDSSGNTTLVQPKVVRQVISNETSKQACDILETVVSQGTGRNAQVKGYRLCGKTGTSQKRDPKTHEYMVGKYVTSFICFAPAEDPQVAILVLLDEPMYGPANLRTGGGMVAPIVGRMMADILPYLGIEPQYEEGEAAGVDITVPEVTGSLKEAEALLNDRGIAFVKVGDGDLVTAQVPSSGARVPGTAKIILYLGGAEPAGEVRVPDLLGMTAEQANKALTDIGLYMRAIGATSAQGGSIVAGRQDVAAETKVPPGTVIEVEFIDNSIRD